MRRTRGKIGAYEVWNEPGHKLGPPVYARIAAATRKVQRQVDPDALLVGHSSTKGPGQGQGGNPAKDPGFLAAVVAESAPDVVDVVSYHSTHAYPFFGSSITPRDVEHDFVARMRRVVGPDVAIWDTERGEAWDSPHERLDKFGHSRVRDVIDSGSPMVVANRLPLLYAAALNDGVERLFWFYYVSSTETLANSITRLGLFDADFEPAPHLVAYAAMTRRLGGNRFVRLIQTPNGTVLYLWRRGDEVGGLLANWLDREETLVLGGDYEGLVVEDVFGRPMTTTGPGSGPRLTAGGVTKYLRFDRARPQTLTLGAP